MSSQPPEFDVLSWFQLDALDMIAARERGRLINRMLNIRSSGDEVEKTVRSILARRLEHSAYVTHGHLVDTALTVSPQLDVIIARRDLFPVLNVLRDGSEHILYSATHAIGEIKASYRKGEDGNNIIGFCEKVKRIKATLSRENASLEDMLPGIRLRMSPSFAFVDRDNWPYHNPLFAFMIIVNSNGFQPGDIAPYYLNTEDRYLPNVVCLLDRGLVVNCDIHVSDSLNVREIRSINEIPEFAAAETADRKNWWAVFTHSDHTHKEGRNLLILHHFLTSVISKTFLRKADLAQWLSENIRVGPSPILIPPTAATS